MRFYNFKKSKIGGSTDAHVSLFATNVFDCSYTLQPTCFHVSDEFFSEL
jgi:hypothetical protein